GQLRAANGARANGDGRRGSGGPGRRRPGRRPAGRQLSGPQLTNSRCARRSPMRASLVHAESDEHIHPAHLPWRLIAAGTAGNVMEWYDFAVYGYFAATIGRQFFPSSDATTSLIAAFGVFAAGFLMRPLGGVVFGHIGDHVGRKAALTISVLAMAI